MVYIPLLSQHQIDERLGLLLVSFASLMLARTARARLAAQRHPAIVSEIVRQEDRGHSAAAQLPLDAVGTSDGRLRASRGSGMGPFEVGLYSIRGAEPHDQNVAALTDIRVD